jgi:hypothetical protein
MAKSTAPSNQDSTPKRAESQDNFKVKAAVYAQLRNLHKFDTILFNRMVNNSCPGALKSLGDWDTFRAGYQTSGDKQ